MCGLSGLVTDSYRDLVAPILRMNNCQRHRGPDDTGHVVDRFGRGQIALGHNRLSIIDLSAAGAQPMRDRQTGSVIILNGEIYNYRAIRRELAALGIEFHSNSDTEVLLQALVAWGPECLKRIEGMYAFAFFDPRRQSLVLARDPVGIKPLYWTPDSKSLAFGSEIRAILMSGLVEPDLDSESFSGMFAYGAFQQPHTGFRAVKAFPAGSYAEIRPGDSSLWEIASTKRHWSPPPQQRVTPAQAVDITRASLSESVKSHLVSDVPVGVFMSSGIDSTVVTALAARASSDCTALTVGFPDDIDFSEMAVARRTAQTLGIKHRCIDVSSEDAPSWARHWLTSLDQPALDGLNVFVISKVARDQGLIVVLSGQGGDEIFGGYPSFRDVPRLWRYKRMLDRLPKGLRSTIGSTAGSFLARSRAQKLYDIFAGPGDIRSLYLQRRRLMSEMDLSNLGFRVARDLDLGLSRDEAVDAADPLKAISELEIEYYLGNTLLHVGDTASMANSVELRVPMLGLPMLNDVLSIPGALRFPHGHNNKHLLRQAFGEFIPAEVLSQRKRGFVFPISRWMQSSLREICESGLTTLRNSGLCDPKGVDSIWSTYLDEPESPAWSRAWALCVTGTWLAGLESQAANARSHVWTA
jgi:asparagine synthase (glutamine-hydrolysing)